MSIKRAVLAMGLAVGMSGAAWAGAPATTGLGQAWPNATDVSVNPNFHAYVFVIGGIQYIQINDAAGHVLGAVGNAAGQYIVLPVGKFAQQVSTPQQAAPATSATPTAAPTAVYNDGTTAVTATPMSDGTMTLSTNVACDPIECNNKGA
jgi:hypothetical protein